ncbi:polysaccharide biosynthesis protein [Veillonella caviae]|uniref:putative polysaccharide biosynthesis protein n=1 Tax=Veillonella caviae TaxID=248316 RepID=UPI002355F732|nr:polysaccharide biosynthesis protein [Veillonella caviae]MCI5708257.1 polysaccharide biosynthesis protein [Veillonella caviae]MCI7694139.1 polysaccharide biosynthesis protein [Veillonella caviae]MDD7291037.1 polysaccharide biosynthesis protein [Veillonella caviae]MDY5254217.1 polysaccharide biosynthesis protein [Veillonella caviae]MDY5715729.1 polysaccharide biosynthesis protein [Veillonella caviae]
MASGFIKGTLILTIAGFVVKAIGSINWILLSRILGGEGIGIYQMAFPIYLLLLQVSSAGVPIAISILTAERLALSDYTGAKRVFTISFIMLTITGLIASLAMYVGADWLISSGIIAEPRAYYSIIALAPAVFFVTWISCFRGYIQGYEMMTPTAISQIVEQLLRVVVMLGAASILLPYGLPEAAGGASLGAGIGAFGAFLVLLYYYYKLPRSSSSGESYDGPRESGKEILTRLVWLALPISLASIMLPLTANLDLLIVPRRLLDAGFAMNEVTELFGYLTGMAVPLINLATIITAAIATSIVPAISHAFAKQDTQGIYDRTASSMRLSFMATVPFTVLLYVLAAPTVTLIYNAPKAELATQITAFAIFFLGIHQVTTGILQGLGKPRIPVINMAIALIIKVALNWHLTAIPELGIGGAAWATVADIGFAGLLNLIYIKKYTGYFLDISLLWKNIVSAGIMGILIYMSYHALHGVIPMWANFLLTGVEGLILYVIIMILLKGINQNDGANMPIIGKFFR